MGSVRSWVFAGSIVTLSALANAQYSIVDNLPGAFLDIGANATPANQGTPLGLADDASTTIPRTIQNALFPLGRTVVSNNGGMAFAPTSDVLTPGPSPLPSVDAFGMSKSLLCAWDDPGDSTGDVYWKEIAGVLYVQWDNRTLNASGATATFQIQIFDGAAFQCDVYAQFLYHDIEDPRILGGNVFTVGYQETELGIQWDTAQHPLTNSTVLSLTCANSPAPGSLGAVVFGLCLASRRRR